MCSFEDAMPCKAKWGFKAEVIHLLMKSVETWSCLSWGHIVIEIFNHNSILFSLFNIDDFFFVSFLLLDFKECTAVNKNNPSEILQFEAYPFLIFIYFLHYGCI
jgi:hypothetical protein